MPTTIEASSLKDLSAACQRLGADVRYRPEAHYFTALACNEWGASALEEATALQPVSYTHLTLPTIVHV